SSGSSSLCWTGERDGGNWVDSLNSALTDAEDAERPTDAPGWREPGETSDGRDVRGSDDSAGAGPRARRPRGDARRSRASRRGDGRSARPAYHAGWPRRARSPRPWARAIWVSLRDKEGGHELETGLVGAQRCSDSSRDTLMS